MYRCMFDELGGSSHATPEFGTMAKGSGCIDLMIKEVGWGFEFLWNGSGAGEHHYRFDTNGPFGQWVQSRLLKEWVLVDYRTNEPKTNGMFILHLFQEF